MNHTVNIRCECERQGNGRPANPGSRKLGGLNIRAMTKWIGSLVAVAIVPLVAEAQIGWTEVITAGPSPRNDHAMAYDEARDVTVMFGGFHVPGFPPTFGDTWEWDGVNWTQVASTGPAPRSSHAMAYDARRGVTVLFGGFDANSNDLGDTWEWDGASWRQVAFSGPTARFGHAMAYDRVRRVTVLFGGDAENREDTWEWDGTSWNEVVAPGPLGRRVHAMAYDASRRVTVLFGGINDDAGFVALDDTWEFDGTGWTEVVTPGPAARHSHAMAYHHGLKRIVLFGGFFSLDDTWEFDGTGWTEVVTPGPAARSSHSMAYDAEREVIVLFGGTSPDFGDTWEFGDLDPGIRGSVFGLTPDRVVCRNLTTGQTISVPTGDQSWNCEDLGLIVNPNDTIITGVRGEAN